MYIVTEPIRYDLYDLNALYFNQIGTYFAIPGLIVKTIRHVIIALLLLLLYYLLTFVSIQAPIRWI